MKTIKNTSLQGLSITLTEGEKVRSIYLMPGKKVEVPNNAGGNVLTNLVARRMVKVTETVVTPVPEPVKILKKSKKSPTTIGK